MHVKVICKMTNMVMDMILQLLNKAFKVAQLPKNHYKVKNNCGLSVWVISQFIHEEMIVPCFEKKLQSYKNVLLVKVVTRSRTRC